MVLGISLFGPLCVYLAVLSTLVAVADKCPTELYATLCLILNQIATEAIAMLISMLCRSVNTGFI